MARSWTCRTPPSPGSVTIRAGVDVVEPLIS
jgi:hypothetical protein